MEKELDPIGIEVKVANTTYEAFESAMKLIAIDALKWDKEKREQGNVCGSKANMVYLRKINNHDPYLNSINRTNPFSTYCFI
jgi:hypothetical protein